MTDTSGPRQVRTTLTAVGPRSALKIGAAVGVCLFVAWMIAAALVHVLLGATGVWDRVNSLAGDLFAADGLSTGTYFGLAALLGLVEVVVVTLLFPLGAVLYTAVAGFVGGLEVTVDAADVDAADVAADAVAEDSGDSADADGADVAADADGTAPVTAPEVSATPGTPAGTPLTGPAAAGWGLRPATPGGTGGHHAE